MAETKYKKRRGDRRDGRKVRDIDAVHFILPYLMPNRCDAEVCMFHNVDVTNLMKYLETVNTSDAPYRTTAFHVIVTAVAKTLYHRPLLNRFISNKHFFDRDEITLSFMAKRRFEDHSEEAVMTLRCDENTTLPDVSRRIVGDVHHIREGNKNDMDGTLGFLKKMPRPVMRFIMACFRSLDRNDMMPASINEGDTNYSSVLLSNLGSIKCGAVYHHLNNYGTNSVLVTIGEIHKEPVYAADGSSEIRDVVQLGITLDERIADGFYFAKSVKLLEKILQDPAALEHPIKEEITE